ncbi:MAG: hypothetical protein GOMPHAMPRED_008191 [Gomphillus americanus]|uniref:Uncharacterized protein n=1 Tax=Gomphillus americanus TaxID=1940652 RepID=A0A8H3EZ54_9LECA|nr:MAG: hypothetical protein GOMPHAMPRED_008191 [Gomphillus americanus]
MRSGITYAALLTAATASAADYAENLAARDHVAEYLADLVARSNLDAFPEASDEYLVGRDYDEEYYLDNLMARDDGAQFSDEDMLYARHPDAEPILGLNHIGKWMGQAAGAVSGGYKSRSNGKNGKYAKNQGGYNQNQGAPMQNQGGSYGSYGGGDAGGDMMTRRSADDDEALEELFYVREAEPEPEFEYYDQYLPYRRSADQIDFQDELFYAREAEAEPEPVLGLNHVSKWTGQAAGSMVGGFKSRSGGKSGGKADKYGSGYSKYKRRSAEEDMSYEDELYIREAEPILGLNTVGKWMGQAAGSVAGGFRSKSAGKNKDKSGKKDKGGGGYGGGDMGGGGYGQGSLI